LRDDAQANAVNLAAPLADGDHVNIPTVAEAEQGVTAAVQPAAGGPAPGRAAAAQAPAGKVNINTADAAALQTLDGVGPATANRIIEYRQANGPFKTTEDLKKVSGIGERKYAAMAAKICV
jgi:competence protein ComEA